MSKRSLPNEGLPKQTRKKKLIVGVRQQQRRIKLNEEQMDGIYSSLLPV